jgi:stage IV sporulation protein B
MKNIKFGRKIVLSIALFALMCISVLSFYNISIPKTVSCFSGQSVPSFLGASFEASSDEDLSAGSVLHGQYKLFGAIPVKSVTVSQLEDSKVYVGGVPFGIKFLTRGVSIVGFEDEQNNPAFAAGLRLYDNIIKINGKEISGNTDVTNVVSGGGEIALTFLRAGKEKTVKVTPIFSEAEKRYTLGLWLKDSGAGIGTLTYVTSDGYFGGLGHGICDGDTGELVPITSGSVLGVTLNGIVKGQRGAPGELKGYFNSSKIGAIFKNSDVGVFGALAQIPDSIKEKTYSIGLKGELREGKATVLCTLDDNVRREYSIEISNINRNSDGNKCFNIKITDDRLIGATGGIVQGMSGSPIIQNGKLVGAVTHVLINDPTTGYGIFIENMLNAAQMPQKRAA